MGPNNKHHDVISKNNQTSSKKDQKLSKNNPKMIKEGWKSYGEKSYELLSTAGGHLRNL